MRNKGIREIKWQKKNEELKGKGYLNPTDEDVLSYALFPQVAEEFFKAHYKPITAYVKE